MSFRANDPSTSQSSMFDATSMMTEREKRYLEKSWAKVFAEDPVFQSVGWMTLLTLAS